MACLFRVLLDTVSRMRSVYKIDVELQAYAGQLFIVFPKENDLVEGNSWNLTIENLGPSHDEPGQCEVEITGMQYKPVIRENRDEISKFVVDHIRDYSRSFYSRYMKGQKV